jgi:RNA polymerase sigma-70 factor, ECF subfamily
MTRPRIDARSPQAPSPITADRSAADRTEEGQLLVRHRGGDTDAFAELVARYRRPVYSYLVRCGVDEAARDDLFQEVFTSIHRAAASYQPERPVKPWVFTIVANIVRGHYRKSRLREAAAAATDPEPIDSAPDSHQLVEARETAAWIEHAIAALPFSQREVVVLCCIEQLPQDDVAATLGVPVNTVKTHLRRARSALAQALARRQAVLRREVSA